MNLSLLDPFDLQYLPEVIDDVWEDGYISSTCFNATGTMLAAACSDGRVLIYDFESRSLFKSLWGHTRQVSNVCWMSDDIVLSCGKDWNMIGWSVSEGRKFTYEFDCPVQQVEVGKDQQLLVSLGNARWPVLMRLDGERIKLTQVEPAATTGAHLASFDRDCKFIVIGTNNGSLIVLDSNGQHLNTQKLSNGAVKQVQVSNDNKKLVVNSSDRVLRLFDVTDYKEPILLHKFQDQVNRLQWTYCVFSNDGEHLIAGSSLDHNLYAWDISSFTIAKILEGPRDPVQHLAWHPQRSIVVSVSTYGLIYIWLKPYTEHFSAYAPGFRELEHNIEYEEKEDEFDVKEVEVVQQVEEAFIDVVN